MREPKGRCETVFFGSRYFFELKEDQCEKKGKQNYSGYLSWPARPPMPSRRMQMAGSAFLTPAAAFIMIYAVKGEFEIRLIQHSGLLVCGE